MTDKAIRHGGLKLHQASAHPWRRWPPRLGDKLHLDEMLLSFQGDHPDLLQVWEQAGTILETPVERQGDE
jgi:hypothetical protein